MFAARLCIPGWSQTLFAARILAISLQSGIYQAEIDSEFIENIGFLAAMHDVGKIGTPDDILNKAGPLEKREHEIMEEHTINGAFILNSYPNPMAKEIALFHHEKWDGTGYPYSFSKDMISLCARIPEFPHEKALQIIQSESGTHFEPGLILTFA